MTIPQESSSSGRGSRGGEAASLSLIKVRRAARAAETIGKTTDLTHRLHRPPIDAVPTVVARGSPSSNTPILPAVPESNPPPLDTSTPFSDTPGAVSVPDMPRAANSAPQAHVAPPPATPPQKPAAADTARATPLLRENFQSREALLDYWDALRRGRDVPLFASLDRTRIAVSWANSLIVSYGGGDKAMPQITRLSRLTGEVEYTSMVTEWILSCSRQVARTGEPMEKEQDFPVEHRSKSYRMLLLPFSSAGGESDYVLCHLSCVG